MLRSLYKSFFKEKKQYNPVDAAQLKRYNAARPQGAQSTLCYAPFKSLYFGHRGKVFACCYNRQYVLGTFPQSSIREIWFGKEADKLREYIQHDDLSLGCFGCENQFRAENFDAIKASAYDQYRANKNRYPSVMEFELSNVCNLECIMCNGEFSSSIRKNREKKSPLESAYDSTFVAQLEEFIPYLDEVKFYGGEPFLIEIYYEIWEKIAELNPNCRISVQTNATTLNNRVKNLLNKGNFHLNISLDSLDKVNYETIRVNAKFERVMENIRYFKEYADSRGSFFGISACVMRDNWKELPHFIDFCNELDISIYFHTVYFPNERALWNLDAQQLVEICDYLNRFDFPQENDVQQKNHTHYFDTLKLITQWKADAISRESEIEQYRNNLNENDPLQLLYNRLKDHVDNSSSIPASEKDQKLNLYFGKLVSGFKLLPDNYPVQDIIDYISSQDLGELIRELDSNQEEKLLKRALELSLKLKA